MIFNNVVEKDTPLWFHEERNKEDVYIAIANEVIESKERLDASIKYLNDGGLDDKEKFIVTNEVENNRERYERVKREADKLYRKPYFAHVGTSENGTKNEYYLSDNEYLEGCHVIEENGLLVPFKQDINAPFLSELFHCYQAKNGESFTDKEGNLVEPTLICEDDILNRELRNATLFYSSDESMRPYIDEEQQRIIADEMLARKLKENRRNPALSNIISTLQLNQFEIIRNDVTADFAVQGCAGSGKSQILIHRLFFLRDILSDSNWEKVLLITPTELFRSYSSELIHRYNLSDIKNTSIAEFYKSLIEECGVDFKKRRCVFEFSEEYLPNGYLHEIYSKETISRIDEEIDMAIEKYVSMACELIGTEVPDECNKETIKGIVAGLTKKIKEIDEKKETLINQTTDPKAKPKWKQLTAEMQKAESVLNKLKIEQLEREKKLEQFENVYSKYVNSKNSSNSANKEYEADLMAICKKEKPELFRRSMLAKLDALAVTISQQQNILDALIKQRKQVGLSLMEPAKREEYEKQLNNIHSKCIKMRKYLNNIESAIFEREIWKVVLPLKEKYGLRTIETTEDNNKQRVLYKSDLVFYLRICLQLNSSKTFPKYNLICIDEGQDLQPVDYETMRKVFPRAAFNIFGDKAQSMHSKSGIGNWRKETKVKNVYSLNKNYRNTAAIVEFCNKKFGASMEYVGNPKDDIAPVLIKEKSSILELLKNNDLTIIVKNKEEFLKLCSVIEMSEDSFEFLDTNSVATGSGRIKCYTIHAAKGLEFSKVLVYSKRMTKNQKVVACTRAMEELFYYE